MSWSRSTTRPTSTTLSTAAQAAGSELGILVEVDTGMDRCGADTPDDALALGRHVAERRGLRLVGITGYEGHCSLTPDHDLRLAKERTAMAFFIEVAERFEARGTAVPDPVGRRDRDLGVDRRRTRGSPRSRPGRTS